MYTYIVRITLWDWLKISKNFKKIILSAFYTERVLTGVILIFDLLRILRTISKTIVQARLLERVEVSAGHERIPVQSKARDEIPIKATKA